MTPQEIFDFRMRLGVTQNELAYMLNSNPTTVSRWESGVFSPSRAYVREIKRLDKEKFPEKCTQHCIDATSEI